MKDLLCVDGLDDVDSVYAWKLSVMIDFNGNWLNPRIIHQKNPNEAPTVGKPRLFWTNRLHSGKKYPNGVPTIKKHCLLWIKKLRHHMMPQFEILAAISKFMAKPPLCIQL